METKININGMSIADVAQAKAEAMSFSELKEYTITSLYDSYKQDEQVLIEDAKAFGLT